MQGLISGIEGSFPIAFSTYATEERQYNCTNSTEPAVFRGIQADTTDSFDTLAFSFTCPVSGYYLLTLTVRNLVNTHALMRIYIESQQRAGVSCMDGTGEHDIQQASNTVIAECEAGERVWLRSKCENDSGADNERFLAFAGFLIR